MSLTQVAGHLVGALSAVAVMHALFLLASRKIAERRAVSELESIGAQIGIPPGELLNTKHDSAIRDAALARYNSEMLRNRLSDAMGSILYVAGLLVGIAQVAILAGTAWHGWREGELEAQAFWLMPFTYLLYLVLVVTISLACILVTGRAPGQAKMTRRAFGYRM